MTISRRLVDQRLRNRIVEALLGLLDWRRDVAIGNLDSYFNDAFGQLEPDAWETNEALSEKERSALMPVAQALESAARLDLSRLQLIESPTLLLLEKAARDALAIFLVRGRFSETHEEAEPRPE